MALETPIGRVRGLGSAKSGTHHWWMERLTAIALTPLSIWFVASILGLIGADHAVIAAWIGQPWVAILLVLFVAVLFYHLKLGLQVVIEDYVHSEGRKIACLVLNSFFTVALGVASVFSILKIAFGG